MFKLRMAIVVISLLALAFFLWLTTASFATAETITHELVATQYLLAAGLAWVAIVLTVVSEPVE